LPDARGHGASDKPHDPESYYSALLAADIVAVLNDVGVEQTHFVDYSMGGRIGFALAKY
jgi:pimeloyl-ACP methyl ester carboxylesterase